MNEAGDTSKRPLLSYTREFNNKSNNIDNINAAPFNYLQNIVSCSDIQCTEYNSIMHCQICQYHYRFQM